MQRPALRAAADRQIIVGRAKDARHNTQSALRRPPLGAWRLSGEAAKQTGPALRMRGRVWRALSLGREQGARIDYDSHGLSGGRSAAPILVRSSANVRSSADA